MGPDSRKGVQPFLQREGVLGRDPFGGEGARGGKTLGAATGSVCPEPSFGSAQAQPSERERVCVCMCVCVSVCVCVCVYDWRRHRGPRASPPCQDPHDPCLASPERCPQDVSVQEWVGPQAAEQVGPQFLVGGFLAWVYRAPLQIVQTHPLLKHVFFCPSPP